MKQIYKCYENITSKRRKAGLLAGKSKAYQKAIFMNILVFGGFSIRHFRE